MVRAEIRDDLIESLLLSLTDAKKGQPDALSAHPLHVSPINHERPFQARHIDAQLQSDAQLQRQRTLQPTPAYREIKQKARPLTLRRV